MRSMLLALGLFLGSYAAELSAQPPPGVPRTVRIFKLKNGDAEKLRGVVSTIFGREGISAVADPRTNSLIVSGAADTLEEIRKLVEELDKPAKPPQ